MFSLTRRGLLVGASIAALSFGHISAFAANQTVRIGTDVDAASLDP